MSKKTKVIAVLNQKGGSGKTSISTNLSYALKQDDFKVLLVDSDPQGSARDWNEAGNGEVVPVVGLDRDTLAKDLNAIKGGYDWVIIDGAPQVERLSAAAVKAADLVLIPVQPSPYDVWACADLVDMVKTAQVVRDGSPIALFVISRAIKNTKLSSDVAQAVTDYELPVLEAMTTQRVSYPTSAADGQTVFHVADDKAINEILSIKNEVMEALR